jgi:hypothetical protein
VNRPFAGSSVEKRAPLSTVNGGRGLLILDFGSMGKLVRALEIKSGRELSTA